MSSFLRSVSRLWHKMNSNQPPDVGPDARSPNQYIFPRTLLNQPSRDAAGNDKAYTPDDLLSSILEHPDALDTIGSIHVTMVSYYKERTGAQHEYLRFRVDINGTDSHPGLQNFLKLDRCPQPEDKLNTPPKVFALMPSYFETLPSNVSVEGAAAGNTKSSTGSQSSLSIMSASSDLPRNRIAQDQFHVSASGNASSYTGQAKEIASVHFNDPKPTLEQVVVLARVVSENRPRYDLFRSQCYWYAYTVWEVLKLEFAASAKWPEGPVGAGTNKLVPWIELNKRSLPEDGKVQLGTKISHSHLTLAANYLISWDEFKVDSTERQRLHGTRAVNERLRNLHQEVGDLHQDNDNLHQEVEDLRRQLEEMRRSAGSASIG